MVLKQCGQQATTFFAPASFSVSTFCWASMENTNSLPIRRAGSPVHVSAGPSTANFTPAVCSSVAIALVVFLARSSSAPAQPTQNRYSISGSILPSTTGTSKSSSAIHSARRVSPMPHGSPLFSRFAASRPPRPGTPTRSAPGAGASRRCGRCARCRPGTPPRTPRSWCRTRSRPGRSRRRPVPTSGRSASAFTSSGSFSRSSSLAASRYGALAKAWSRRSRMTCLGDSGLPVAQAGHCDWHRPHSVQVAMSSRPFQVKSSILPQPEHVGVRVGLLEVQHLAVAAHRLQRAEGVRPPGEQDVQRGQRDVQVLGVDHDDREGHDHGDLGRG